MTTTTATAPGTIPAGTRVRVRTSNGGDAVFTLYSAYRPTYAVCVHDGDPARRRVIGGERLTSVERA